MLTAVAAYGFVRAGQPLRGAVVFGIGAVALTMSMFAMGAARVDRHQTFDRFVSAAFQRSENPRIGSLGVLEPSWVFYTERPFDHLFAPELAGQVDPDTPIIGKPRSRDWEVKPLVNCWHFLGAGPDRFVITTATHLKQLGPLPPHVEVVSRAPYFLKDEELVLLSSHAMIAHRPAGESKKRNRR
jgi:hypothetical protein